MQKLDNGRLKLVLDDVLQHIKNRPPILMIHEAIVLPGEYAVANVALSGDEWFFACHFPGDPIVPGALQLESMFNAAALTIKTLEGKREMTSNIGKISNASFRRPIRPGEVMRVETRVTRPYRRGTATFAGSLSVNGELACEAEFVLTIPEEMILKGENKHGNDQ